MSQEPLFTVIDLRAVFAAGMAPAQWIREQRRGLEWSAAPFSVVKVLRGNITPPAF